MDLQSIHCFVILGTLDETWWNTFLIILYKTLEKGLTSHIIIKQRPIHNTFFLIILWIKYVLPVCVDRYACSSLVSFHPVQPQIVYYSAQPNCFSVAFSGTKCSRALLSGSVQISQYLFTIMDLMISKHVYDQSANSQWKLWYYSHLILIQSTTRCGLNTKFTW